MLTPDMPRTKLTQCNANCLTDFLELVVQTYETHFKQITPELDLHDYSLFLAYDLMEKLLEEMHTKKQLKEMEETNKPMSSRCCAQLKKGKKRCTRNARSNEKTCTTHRDDPVLEWPDEEEFCIEPRAYKEPDPNEPRVIRKAPNGAFYLPGTN